MDIQLVELAHQKEALKAIIDSFSGLANATNTIVNSNPLIKNAYTDEANIDIKMETGTGKTYVGTRAMYELHKQFGLYKFIVVVPTPAIKEGWKSFLTADYAKQHFSEFYENSSLSVNVINAGDFGSGQKIRMATQISEFVSATNQNSHQIEVLLINAGMLNSKSFKREDYPQSLEGGFYSPQEGVAQTKPVVIIDEPHRFPRKKANYKAIEAIKPQMIVRLGATFNEDYYRGEPQFDLDAVKSMEDKLVKAIDIYYPKLSEAQAQDIWRVSFKDRNKTLVLTQGNKSREISLGEDIGFEGDITYEGSKILSSGLELEDGMKIIPNTFSNTYQEIIISDAIDKHFEKERDNFFKQTKIKTLSLFFIDSIASYRENEGWLKKTFEKLLAQKLDKLIGDYKNKGQKSALEQEYLEFLHVSKVSLTSENQDIHAGYFGQDNLTGEAQIQAEVDDILRNKSKLLTFKNENGNWNTRRFLFSKWTLREGWDNPNIFVITKLRTSGSETSKMQEVGRGLRRPVDETGQRQEKGDFRLDFLIGYDEKGFAQKLVGEINANSSYHLNETSLTNEMLAKIVNVSGKDDNELLQELMLEHKIIDFNRDFKEDGLTRLLELYPAVSGVGNQVTVNKQNPASRIKLRKKNWEKVRELWKSFAQRRLIKFERLADEEKIALLEQAFTDCFVKQVVEQVQSTIDVSDGQAMATVEKGSYEASYETGKLGYGQFLKKFALETGVEVELVHRVLTLHLKKFPKNVEKLNEHSLDNAKKKFKQGFEQSYAMKYEYEILDFSASTSLYKNDDFVEDIEADWLGVKELSNVSDEVRYLYERPPIRYDSEQPEKELLTRKYKEGVVVFGKLPKSAIRIPKYIGGTTSPDFVYLLDDKITLLVETKAENMRVGDKIITEIQEKYFKDFENIQYQVATTEREVVQLLEKLKS